MFKDFKGLFSLGAPESFQLCSVLAEKVGQPNSYKHTNNKQTRD